LGKKLKKTNFKKLAVTVALAELWSIGRSTGSSKIELSVDVDRSQPRPN